MDKFGANPEIQHVDPAAAADIDAAWAEMLRQPVRGDRRIFQTLSSPGYDQGDGIQLQRFNMPTSTHPHRNRYEARITRRYLKRETETSRPVLEAAWVDLPVDAETGRLPEDQLTSWMEQDPQRAARTALWAGRLAGRRFASLKNNNLINIPSPGPTVTLGIGLSPQIKDIDLNPKVLTDLAACLGFTPQDSAGYHITFVNRPSGATMVGGQYDPAKRQTTIFLPTILEHERTKSRDNGQPQAKVSEILAKQMFCHKMHSQNEGVAPRNKPWDAYLIGLHIMSLLPSIYVSETTKNMGLALAALIPYGVVMGSAYIIYARSPHWELNTSIIDYSKLPKEAQIDNLTTIKLPES